MILSVGGLTFVTACLFAQGGVTSDVSAYGAAGDGVTDDGPALQRAIDRQPAGGTLYFGDRTRIYLISRQLVLRPNLRYTGSATIRMAAGVARGTQLAVLRYGQADNVVIEGLTLDANGVGGGLAIDVQGNGGQPARHVTVMGVTFLHTIASIRGPYDSAIYDPVGLQDAEVTRNLFEDCGSGISIVNADRVVVSDNQFHDIHRGDAVFLTFSPGGNWAGHDLKILRNTGRHLGRMAIEVWARQPTDVDGVTVRENSFEDWAGDARGNGFGISMMTGRRAIVSDNTMLGKAEGLTFGLEMGAPGSIVERNRIEGFRVGIALHCGDGTQLRENRLLRQDEAAIQITNAPGTKSDLLIESNTITDPHRFGIWANSEGWGGSRLLGNRISRAAGAFADDGQGSFVGIAVSPPARPVTIAGNTILQTAAALVPGFSFAGLKINGRAGANLGSTYEGNTIASASGRPFGAGLVLNGPGSADGVTLDGNRFQGLAAVTMGPASRDIVLRGNTVRQCASAGMLAGH